MTDIAAGHRRNVEFKVRCSAADLDRVLVSLAEGDGPVPVSARQVDTYFGAPAGRLKLRVTGPIEPPGAGDVPDAAPGPGEGNVPDAALREGAELIAYRRPDDASGRWSAYELVPVPVGQADSLTAALALALGVTGQVVKVRTVVILGMTRVHLDRVEGQGTFIELETVAGDRPEGEVTAEFDAVVARLGLGGLDAVAGSYRDGA